MAKRKENTLEKKAKTATIAPGAANEETSDEKLAFAKIQFRKNWKEAKLDKYADVPEEDGDDEYIPDDGLKLEAYKMKIELACKKGGSTDDVRNNIGTFLNHLKLGLFKLYSSYTRIGRQNVRLDSISDSAKWKSDENGEYLIFEVTFKVNDPVTDVVLS